MGHYLTELPSLEFLVPAKSYWFFSSSYPKLFWKQKWVLEGLLLQPHPSHPFQNISLYVTTKNCPFPCAGTIQDPANTKNKAQKFQQTGNIVCMKQESFQVFLCLSLNDSFLTQSLLLRTEEELVCEHSISQRIVLMRQLSSRNEKTRMTLCLESHTAWKL